MAVFDANNLQPFNAIVVPTGSITTILLPRHNVLLRHTDFQDDLSASVAGDHVIVMQATKQDGTPQIMSADRSAGEKLIIEAGLSVTFRGDDIRTGTNGDREIQLQAVTNGALVQVLTARNQLI